MSIMCALLFFLPFVASQESKKRVYGENRKIMFVVNFILIYKHLMKN